MENTITKGTGNSRSIKSVPNLLTLYPTWEAAAQAMIDGTFPIDLGPLNPAGVQTMGTELNKANLLSDETAALYPGLPENPVPDDVLAAIGPLLNTALARAKIMTGSYTGTGGYGATNPNSISFPFTPKIVFITRHKFAGANIGLFLVYALTSEWAHNGYYPIDSTTGSRYSYAKLSNKNLMWYDSNNDPGGQLNFSGYPYDYLAIG